MSDDWQAQLRQGRLLQLEAPELAAIHFQMALELAPGNPEALMALGQALLESGRPAEALEQFHTLLEDPAPAVEVRFWQALTLEQLDQPQEALICLQALLRQQPQHAPARLLQGRLEARLGQLQFAIASYRQYLQLQPADLDACFELAEVLDAANEKTEAADIFLLIYQQDPEQTQALLRWLQLRALDDPQLMVHLLIQLARETPLLRSHIAVQMASLMEHASEIEERQKCLEMALEDPLLPERAAWQLRAGLSLPHLPADAGEITQALEHLDAQLRAFETRLPHGAGVMPDFSNLQPYLRTWTPFCFMPYLNVDPLPWRRRWGELFRQLLPEGPVPAGPGTGEVRIGFVINQNTSVRAFLLDLLRRWPAGQGRVVVFLNPPPAGTMQPGLPVLHPEFEQYLLPQDPGQALAMVAAARLDLLFLSEIHTDQLLQSLMACYRLAPIQVTSWLSSGSSGLPFVDYHISSHLVEQSENPQRFYSEKLILLDELPGYMVPAMLLDQPPPRSDYGLPEGNLYICPHLIFKMHPDYDAILAEILERDPQGQLVMITNPNNRFLRNRLVARFESRFPQLMPRIWFLPKLSHQDYLGLLTLGDVMLDPFYFGGGTTSFEALGLGVPIVTWPGERQHGRITHGYYRKLDVLECVAYSPQDYVRLAVELGTRPELNANVRSRIRANSHRLFENRASVQAVAECLLQLARQGREKD